VTKDFFNERYESVTKRFYRLKGISQRFKLIYVSLRISRAKNRQINWNFPFPSTSYPHPPSPSAQSFLRPVLLNN